MSSPLNIAILVRKFPNIVQTYILNHILSLKNAGANPVIIAEQDPRLDEVHPDIEAHRLRSDTIYIHANSKSLLNDLLMLPWLRSSFIGMALTCLFSSKLSGFGIGYRIKAILRSRAFITRPFSIMHSHSLFRSHHYLFLKRCYGIPLVTTFHGLEPNNVFNLSAHKMQQVLTESDALLCNTHFAEQQLLELGAKQSNIHIIPQGTNTADFPFHERSINSEEDIVMLSVGRLSIEKGIHIAIDAVAELVKHFPRLQYRIVGTGLEADALKQQVEKLGLQNNITLYGSVSTEELRQHYSDAHMFVLASINLQDGSHTETQGVVLQEAQSSGLPVIASRTGGIPEVIKHGKTGLLFDEGASTQLAENISKLINDTDFYSSLCKQARQDVDDNYSREAIYKRLDALYQQVLSSQD